MYNRALAINEKALGPGHPDVATCLNNLAALYRELGDYAKAEPLYKRSLAIREQALGKDHPEVAQILNNLAVLYDTLGDYAKAEPLYKRALEIKGKSLGKDHPDVANSLNNLAVLYKTLGDYAMAELLYKRSLEIYEKSLGKDHPGVALSLNNLAMLYDDLGDYARAEPLYKRSLEIYEKSLGKDHPKVDTILGNLALLYLTTGQLDKAYERFKGKKGSLTLGKYHLAKKEYVEAEKQFQESLNYHLKKEVKIPKWLITGYIGLGLAFEGQENYGKTKEHFKRAIDLIEKQWRSLSTSARRNFLSGRVGVGFRRLEPYEGMVRVLLKEGASGCEKEALRYAEQVKSRLFLEQLAAKGAKGKTEKDNDILTKDRKFQQEIAVLRKRISTLEGLGTRGPAGDKEKLSKELDIISAEYETFLNEIELSDSELSSLVNVETITTEKLQSLLALDTTLLEYFTAQDRTYAWLVTRNSVKAFKIGADAKLIAKKVNEFRLANTSTKTRRPKPLMTISTGDEQTGEITKSQRKKNQTRCTELYGEFYKTLISPLEKSITTQKLIIVPHGALHKVPFAALTDGNKYLIDKFSLSVLPASSVIEYVVKKRNPNQKRLLAFAVPEVDYVPLDFLDFAEPEVNGIAEFFTRKKVFTKSKATEGIAKEKSSDPDVIHFACHGEFNDKQPQQSGLFLAKDEANDGRLQVHEVFGLNLRNANLVTLSACETGVSKIQGGDDLVGLSRGFIYAGTPSILVTLWEVDDLSTSRLMKYFYENWQVKGMTKPEALRQAQIKLKEFRPDPLHWAPFVMIGDWR